MIEITDEEVEKNEGPNIDPGPPEDEQVNGYYQPQPQPQQYTGDYPPQYQQPQPAGNYPPQYQQQQPAGNYPPQYQQKKLYRSTSDKWIAGVCGGLAEYFNTDPILVRLLWILFIIVANVLALIVYALFWLLVKKYPSYYLPPPPPVPPPEGTGAVHYHYYYGARGDRR